MRRFYLLAAGGFTLLALFSLAVTIEPSRAKAEGGRWSKWFDPFFQPPGATPPPSAGNQPPQSDTVDESATAPSQATPTQDSFTQVNEPAAPGTTFAASSDEVMITDESVTAAEWRAEEHTSGVEPALVDQAHPDAGHPLASQMTTTDRGQAAADEMQQRFDDLSAQLPDEPQEAIQVVYEAPVVSASANEGSAPSTTLTLQPANEPELMETPTDRFNADSIPEPVEADPHEQPLPVIPPPPVRPAPVKPSTGPSEPIAQTQPSAVLDTAAPAPATNSPRRGTERQNDFAEDDFSRAFLDSDDDFETETGADAAVTNRAAAPSARVPSDAFARPSSSTEESDDWQQLMPTDPSAPAKKPKQFPTADVAAGTGLSMQWQVPDSLNRGDEAAFGLVVRNEGAEPAVNVMVHVQLPAAARFVNSRPAATPQGDVVSWQVGQIEAGQSTTIDLTLVATAAGDLMPAAAVTATRLKSARVAVLDPKLELSIEGAEQLALGATDAVTIKVANTGTGPARGIVLTAKSDPRLQVSEDSERRYIIGTLLPGHSREVRITAAGRSAGTGRISASVRAAANLSTELTHEIAVIEPRLAVAISGPKLRYVERPALYTVAVHNPGPATADNVQVVDRVPSGFRFVEASAGGAYDTKTREVAWFVGRLEAGQTAEVDVKLVPITTGDHEVVATAIADATSAARASLPMRVEGSANLVMEVLDSDDPIEVGGETTYEIRIENTGSVAARGVQVAALLNNGLSATAADGAAHATVEPQRVVFNEIASLAPQETARFRIRAKCEQAGRGRLRALVRTSEIDEPILEEESTRIYAD